MSVIYLAGRRVSDVCTEADYCRRKPRDMTACSCHSRHDIPTTLTAYLSEVWSADPRMTDPLAMQNLTLVAVQAKQYDEH